MYPYQAFAGFIYFKMLFFFSFLKDKSELQKEDTKKSGLTKENNSIVLNQ